MNNKKKNQTGSLKALSWWEKNIYYLISFIFVFLLFALVSFSFSFLLRKFNQAFFTSFKCQKVHFQIEKVKEIEEKF